jgi:hypothetical protein
LRTSGREAKARRSARPRGGPGRALLPTRISGDGAAPRARARTAATPRQGRDGEVEGEAEAGRTPSRIARSPKPRGGARPRRSRSKGPVSHFPRLSVMGGAGSASRRATPACLSRRGRWPGAV